MLLLGAPFLCLQEVQGPRESPGQRTPNPRCSHTGWHAIMRSHDTAWPQKSPGLIKHVGKMLVRGNVAINNHPVRQRNRPGMGRWLHAHTRAGRRCHVAPSHVGAGDPVNSHPASSAACGPSLRTHGSDFKLFLPLRLLAPEVKVFPSFP